MIDTVFNIGHEARPFFLRIDFYEKVSIIFASITAGVVAIKGLSAWKQQLRGTSEYELARRLLKAVLKVRDELKNVRNGFQDAGEIYAAFKEHGIEIKSFADMPNGNRSRYVYSIRWKKLVTVFSELEEEMLESEIFWKEEIEAIFKELKGLVVHLSITIENFLMSESVPVSVGQADSKQKQAENKILYGYMGDSGTNEFSKKIEDSIVAFENFLRLKLIRTK